MDELILNKLESIERMLIEQNMLRKEVLNVTETALYLEISESHLYKLTSTGTLPCYKPNGKRIYFNRHELDIWLQTNKQVSIDDIEERVSNFQLKAGRR
ncbi:MAG: helix-turn-helix domain-containing protein [Salinivirgaceae bacterium]|jgi:excisionase family DNA binding protein